MFSEPFLYGFNGIDSTSLNRMVEAGRFVYANSVRLNELVTAQDDSRLTGLLTKVTSSSPIGGASNRWVYTVQSVLPQDQLAGATSPTGSTFNAETAFNLAEFENTASTAGGINATRANGLGFSMLPIPTGTLVITFYMKHSTGGQVLVFSRSNPWDGECPTGASFVQTIDGGVYGAS